MYGHSLPKLSNFFVSIMDKYMLSYHLKKIDQISILLLLLCGNLEKESLNCPSKVAQCFIYL
jgi:hypothetical protein